MMLRLDQLHIGKVDGKHEYLTPANTRDKSVYDSFLVPDSVDPQRMNNGDIFFIEGFRGTGKASLFRWHAEQQRNKGSNTDFILFKTDLTEAQRLGISNEVGISWLDLDPAKMELSQDFKDAWIWFILHKIGENIQNYPEIREDYDGSATKAVKLLGLDDGIALRKVLGFLPKLEGAKIKISAKAAFFEAELGGDFKKSGDQGETTLNALSQRVLKHLKDVEFTRPLYIYFDELETFYHSPEQHRRDQRMVRDLLFAVASVNDILRAAGRPVHILAAVRSEVVDAMGSLGQEVDRLVHDRGFLISWHHSRRSIDHPLLRIISRKLNASEKASGLVESQNPLDTYLAKDVKGESIDVFLLDKSFYKPRDIVWRLSIAQKLFPGETKFTANVLLETEIDYSAKLWDEVRYELSASYSDMEVDGIESVISGGAASFELADMDKRFRAAADKSKLLEKLIGRASTREILSDLYRIGAVGNSFRVGTSSADIRNRWYFRGDPTLLADKRMVLHPALFKRLSVVASRRRGSRGRGSGTGANDTSGA